MRDNIVLTGFTRKDQHTIESCSEDRGVQSSRFEATPG